MIENTFLPTPLFPIQEARTDQEPVLREDPQQSQDTGMRDKGGVTEE